ncbi:MAG: LicD family protein, partial [Clostridia bacterium]|nr:LicD family protein [Clostridia bacterium]
HALCRADFKNVNTKLAKIIGPILSPIFKEEKVYYYKKKILTYQQKYSYVNSKFVSTNADKDSKKEVFPKELFEKSVEVEFEGTKSYAFSHYHEHLKKYYGDYMKLPPNEMQKPKHSFYAQIEDDFIYVDNKKQN